MRTADSPSLHCALEGIATPGVLIGHRIIAEGDEFALLPKEQRAFENSVIKVQRASGAARIAARDLMRRLGIPQQPVPKAAGGMPQWPEGIVGSLAHDAMVAVAALARRAQFLSVGIDIEPAEPLESDLLDIVATSRERAEMQNGAVHGRLLFAIKEAVYKAVYPLDRTFLEHHDVEVNLAARTAAVRDGRTVPFRYGISSHIAVLAFIAAMR